MLPSEIIKKPIPKEPSATLGWMIWGGLFGSLLVTAHIALDVFAILPGCRLPLHPSHLHTTSNPLAHVLTEFAIFGSGGAVVFGLLAVIRERQKRR